MTSRSAASASLAARTFIRAIRGDRNAQIRAIARFCGYDVKGAAPHGVQLERARWEARRILDPSVADLPRSERGRVVALSAADLSAAERAALRAALDSAGRLRAARRSLVEARSILLRARQENDSALVERGLVLEARARDWVVDATRLARVTRDSVEFDRVLREERDLESFSDPPDDPKKELARLIAAQARDARASA